LSINRPASQYQSGVQAGLQANARAARRLPWLAPLQGFPDACVASTRKFSDRTQPARCRQWINRTV